MSQRITVYSHGFGVRQDDRGLFTDIAAGLAGEHKMFDYNQIDEAAKTLTVAPLDEQAQRLAAVVDQVRHDNPRADIDLICHSQGCVVAGMAGLAGLRRVVLLAPPQELSVKRLAALFANRTGSEMVLGGTSVLARKDGSRTLVPATYWRSLPETQPMSLYEAMARTSALTVIYVTEDEVLGPGAFPALPGVSLIPLTADHNFTGASRTALVKLLQEQLA